jgi:hypothetical protein
MDQYRSTRQVESSVASEHVGLSQAWRRAAPRAACHCGSVGPRAQTQTLELVKTENFIRLTTIRGST